MRKRAFIGPIGDDLPSLIPLLFALVMFFSTFTYAFNVFENRNKAFSNDLTVLKISSILKSNGYIETQEAFDRRCVNIGPAAIKYVAVVTNAATAKENFIDVELGGNTSAYVGIDLYDPQPFSITGSSGELFCTNLSEDLADIDIPKFYGIDLIVKVFPVVVEDDKVVKPMHLVVVAWR